jgi:hypothetical protein
MAVTVPSVKPLLKKIKQGGYQAGIYLAKKMTKVQWAFSCKNFVV